MVSYMTGPALLEAIIAVLADRDIHELIVVDNGNTESARAVITAQISPRAIIFFSSIRMRLSQKAPLGSSQMPEIVWLSLGLPVDCFGTKKEKNSAARGVGPLRLYLRL